MTKPMPALTPADLEALSAYLDNELDPAARAEVERRLAAEPDLRAELEALRAVVMRLHAAPLLRAPRDFRLDPAVYGRRPALAPARRVYRWSSAVSALAAMIVLALGLLGVLNRSQFAPAALTSQSAAREAQTAATAQSSAEAQPSAIALAPTATVTVLPQATASPRGMEQEAPAEADTFAAPSLDAGPALDAANAAGEPGSGVITESAADAAAESGFAPAAVPPAVPGQAAGPSDGTSLKQTPEGLGGGATGMGGPPPMATVVVGEALSAQEEAQTSAEGPEAAALSAPAASQPTSDDTFGQRLAPTPTLEIAAAIVVETPTAQLLPTLRPAEAQQPGLTLPPAPQPSLTADESQAAAKTAPTGLDPALLIGGGLGLLALAGVLYALSRR